MNQNKSEKNHDAASESLSVGGAGQTSCRYGINKAMYEAQVHKFMNEWHYFKSEINQK